MTNSGTIEDEGSATTILAPNIYAYGFIANSGAIRNTGTGAAINANLAITNLAGGMITAVGSDVVTGTYLGLTNGGTIANLGAGQAIFGTNISVTNNAGGVISAGSSGTAITAANVLSLVNMGTINGNVLAGSSATSGTGSTVDSTQGMLNGALTFGNGNNTLVAALDNGTLQTGVSGLISAGSGMNTVSITPTASITLAAPLALPNGFTRIDFNSPTAVSVTLASGYSAGGAILVDGGVSLTNAANLSGSGPIIGQTNSYNSFGTFNNSGSITSANSAGPAAINLSGYGSLINSGAITASGDGIAFSGGGFSNSGTITAGGTAISAGLGNYIAGFSNSGTIISTGGTAVTLYEQYGSLGAVSGPSNSGTISGQAIGLNLVGGPFVNAGTISSAGYGVVLGQQTTNIENAASGVITGGTAAIGSLAGLIAGALVSNAGTINGNVDLGSPAYSYSSNIYYAQTGGILNGNLTLGAGGTLVTDLVNPGSGAFAGINGTVTANDANLVYNVAADATTTVGIPGGFAAVGYQLSNPATLTIAAGGTAAGTLALAGTGSVVVNGNVSTTDAIAMRSTAFLSANGYINNSTALTITSNGSISATRTNFSISTPAAVLLGNADTLTNTGTITLLDTTGNANQGYYASEAAINGGQTIVNAGTITGVGAYGVALGGGYFSGQTQTLTNSGTISSDLVAVQVAAYAAPVVTITNSGTISSTGSAAISGGAALIDNLAGGSITGTTDAIDLTSGTLTNGGAITGNVNLGVASSSGTYGSTPVALYIAQGGTISGNLTLNPGTAALLDLASAGSNPFPGVSGTVTANNAAIIYNVTATATTTPATLPAGFSLLQYQLANDPTLTLAGGGSAPGITLGLAGTGTVIVGGTIGTTDRNGIVSQPAVTTSGYSTLANALTIINNGAISTTRTNPYILSLSAVSLGSTDTLTNNGTIAITDLAGASTSGYNTYVAAVTGGHTITNTGSIAGTGTGAIALGDPNSYGFNATTSLANAGTITSDQAAVVVNSAATITNTGVITSSGFAAITSLPFNYNSSLSVIANQTGGTITSVGDAIDLAGGTIANAGTINGNVNLAYTLYGYASFSTGSYFDNGGTLNGNLTLTAGESLVVPLASSGDRLGGVIGTITANGAALIYNVTGDATTTPAAVSGFGSVGYQLSNDAALTIAGKSNLATTLSLAGSGAVILNGTIATIDQVAVSSQPAFAATGLSTTANTLSITNDGTISLTVVNSSFVAAIQLGDADTLVNHGTITFARGTDTPDSAFVAIDGGQSITNNGTIAGTANDGILVGYNSSYSLQNGPATIINSGTISVRHFAVAASTSLGNIVIINSGVITGAIAANYGYIGNASLLPPVITITNSGTIIGKSIYGLDPVAIYASQEDSVFYPVGIPSAAVNLNNSGAINGDIILSNINFSLVNTASGNIIGNIIAQTFPGEGSGSVTLAGGFAGNIDGGAGLANLTVSGGSVTAPVAFGSLANISSYTQTGGYATLNGTASLGAAAIEGGTLVGLVGSTINTPLLIIGAGGAFASGGAVNGNIINRGKLQVGASPDTLTVNGNVTLAAGSTSSFEVSRAASSRLVVSGTVSIAANSTLQIVQLQPIMAGTTLDLITATGGISGSFSALSGITGKLAESGGTLSLLALFDTAPPRPAQTARSIGYVNALLASGNAPAALFAAIPGLTATNGEPLSAAFARLTAEPYASATQIGVENALTLSRVAREIDGAGGTHSGDMFTFGQALGGWRGLGGDAARGTSTAPIGGYGFLGGLGIGHGPVSVVAFGGYLDQTQDTHALGASTQAKGFVGGVTGRLDRGSAQLALSVVYDDAHARTRRDLLDGSQVAAGYDLHGWTLDGEASTAMKLGADWLARPHIGASWVWTQRGAVAETTSSVFSLTVAADHHTAGYVDGGIRFETSENSLSRFTRYLDLGLRYEVQGRGTAALAGYARGPITLLADGVRRAAASALVSVGGRYRVTSAVSLFLSGSGEMTRTGNSTDVTGGIRMSF